jgi:flagellin-like hook-associated protein FlgL
MAQNITLTEGIRANLLSLQNTAKLLELTQKRLATGKRVNSPLDDAINFFAAKNHQQRADDLAFRKDAMGEAIQTIKAADTGIDAITDLIASAKSTAQSALSTTDTAERSTLAVQFNTLMDQIDSLSEDSGYKGVNFLGGDNLTVTFDADGDSTLAITGFEGNADSLLMVDAVNNWTLDANIDAAVTTLDNAKGTLRTKAEGLSNSCRESDQCGYERRRRQHADAPDPAGLGHHGVEPGLSGCPRCSEVILIDQSTLALQTASKLLGRGVIPFPGIGFRK